MTKEEFKNIAGYEVSDDAEWANIYTAYMAGPWDKNEFCTAMRLDSSRRVIRDLGSRLHTFEELCTGLKRQNDKLTDFVFAQSCDPDTEALQSKARELLGRDEYLARMIEAGETLDDEDLAYIAAKIRQ